ncbi:MAG TPA: phosphoesterase, partial [Tissierellaceae bacterium]
MKDNKLFSWSDARIYLVLFLILTIIIGIKNPLLGFICLLIYGYMIYHTYILVEEKNKDLVEDIESLADNFESATKYAIFNMPFPLVMLNSNGDINWYNTPFLNMLEGKDILNKNIKQFIPAIDLGNSNLNKDTEIEVENISYNDKDYLVYFNYINNKKSVTSGDRLVLLYWVDNTKYKDLQIEFDKSKPVVSLVYIDNYEDVKSNTIEVNRPLVLAEIDSRIRDYFNKYNTVVRKYENSKYLVFMDNESLNKIQEKKFDLLDDLRELDIGNKIPITLSIGVSTTEKSLEESYKNARAAIDIALGRGGDQAVLNNNGKFEFFGGKSKALEKRNKVKARVIGYALKQLITQADNVVIMGHTNPDMDAFGSAIGVLRGVKNIEKPGYIVLNEINPSIKNIYNKMKIDQEELIDHFITTE